MKRVALFLGLAFLCSFPSHEALGATHRNVLLVTLDTTRADHFGCYGYDRETSPAIDTVAADAVLFSRAYSVVPLTSPSHVSIMTGLHPLSHGVYRNSQSVPKELVTLAELLKKHGYATAAFVSAIVLSGRAGIDDGFDVYSDVLAHAGEPPDDPRRRMRSADQTVNAALGWLSQHREKKFFLWLHLYEPHLPYLPPDAYGRKFDPDYIAYKKRTEERLRPGPGPEPREGPPLPHPQTRPMMRFPRAVEPAIVASMKNAYDGEIAFADAQLSRVLGFLRKHELYDGTIVVVMGDHGEILYEKRQYFGHHKFMYEGALRIPLVCRIPGVDARRIDQRITNVDILPTLLGALGIATPPGTDGISFWPLLRGGGKVARRPYEIVVSHSRRSGPGPAPEPEIEGVFDPTGVLKDRWKLLMTRRGMEPGTALELYDLGADPDEQRNLYDPESESPIARELRAYLESRLETARERIRHEVLDPETEERLRSLGYLP
jgi:arylsulfatase A-like enzyme